MSALFSSPSDAESTNATTTTPPSIPDALDILIGGAEGLLANKPDDTTMNIEDAMVAVPEIIMDSPQPEVHVQQALEDINIHSIEDHPSVVIASPAEELPEKEEQQQYQLHEEAEEEEHTVTTDLLVVGDDNIASVPTRTTDINQITTATVPLFVLDLQVRDILFMTIHPYLVPISLIFLLNTSLPFWLLSILVSSKRATTIPQTTPTTT